MSAVTASFTLFWIICVSVTRVVSFSNLPTVSAHIKSSTNRITTELDSLRTTVAKKETQRRRFSPQKHRHAMLQLHPREPGFASHLLMVFLLSCQTFQQPALAVDDFYNPTPMNELNRQIRTSVVRGAQLMDKIDGRWENFSDHFGLGEKRTIEKREVTKSSDFVSGSGDGRNGISQFDGNIFDKTFAFDLLKECDLAFLTSFNKQQYQSKFTTQELSSHIQAMKQLVRKSFFPSSDFKATPQEEFNFELYSHFRVYNDILLQEKVVFSPFKQEFESVIGNYLLQYALSTQQPLKSLTSSLAQNALHATDVAATVLLQNGFITSWERSIPSDDDIDDFTNELPAASMDNFYVSPDLRFTLALNGDITLSSQLLLQEMGYRLYPSFGRWLLQQSLPLSSHNEKVSNDSYRKMKIEIDDFYMDTAYNSNPDLFEVKQVLLNIGLELD